MQARVLAVTMQARVQVVGSTVQARAGRRCKHRYGGAISIGSKDKEEDQRKLKNLPELKKTIGGSDRC
uniref:Uncharacterized protein n=1 Tax=Cannabis sativa TaxID=3483 RepID=A0A803NH38_CANSA